MDLKQLEYFRHVAELGSFSRASTFLSIVQPALSKQVRSLEAELGQALFERNGRGVVLTDAGTRLLEHTRGILTQVGRARQELEEQRTGHKGHFSLGLPPSVGRSVTVALVKAFRRQLPNANLATVEGLSAYMLEWLNNGRVDCALVYNSAANQYVDLQPLLKERLYLVMPLTFSRSTRRTVTASELARMPLIMPSRPHALRMALENALADHGVNINIAHEIECIPAIVDLVRQGFGCAILPLNAVRSTPWEAELRVEPIASTVLSTSLYIATSTRRPQTPLMRNAIDIVRDTVRGEIEPQGLNA